MAFAALVTLAGVVAGVAVARDPEPQRLDVVDPCPDCSPEEHVARMYGGVEAMFRSRDDLAARFDSLGVDPRTLPRSSWMREYLPGYTREYVSIDDAARGVEIIAEVEITDVQFEPGDRVVTTAAVLDLLKGAPAARIQFVQDGAVSRDPEDGSLYLIEAEAFPLLLPGDRVVLLLERVGEDLKVVPGYGWLKVEGGLVSPALDGPAVRVVPRGTSLPDTKARLRAALQGGNGG